MPGAIVPSSRQPVATATKLVFFYTSLVAAVLLLTANTLCAELT